MGLKDKFKTTIDKTKNTISAVKEEGMGNAIKGIGEDIIETTKNSLNSGIEKANESFRDYKEKKDEIKALKKLFKPNTIVGDLKVDTINKLFKVENGSSAVFNGRNRDKADNIFPFESFIDFELIEDGSTVASGGIGRALVGGLLFSGAGAIVGAATRKSKNKVDKLILRININSFETPCIMINYITKPTKAKSKEYTNAYNLAQQALSILMVISKDIENKSIPVVNEFDKEGTTNEIDDIRKYKCLLDDGILTQEEFDQKKKGLLGL